MKIYRKKSIVIVAFQMTKERRQNGADWPYWLQLAWQKENFIIGAVSSENYPNSDGTDKLIIHTEEGVHLLVDWDDYIIKDVNGEFQMDAIKTDIFKVNYEEVELIKINDTYDIMIKQEEVELIQISKIQKK